MSDIHKADEIALLTSLIKSYISWNFHRKHIITCQISTLRFWLEPPSPPSPFGSVSYSFTNCTYLFAICSWLLMVLLTGFPIRCLIWLNPPSTFKFRVLFDNTLGKTYPAWCSERTKEDKHWPCALHNWYIALIVQSHLWLTQTLPLGGWLHKSFLAL